LRHTLFMVPTYNPGNGQTDIDFDPRAIYESAKYRKRSVEGNADHVVREIIKLPGIWETYKANPKRTLFILGPTSYNSVISGLPIAPSAQNQGYLCPPNCPPAEVSLLQTIDSMWPDSKITQN